MQCHNLGDLVQKGCLLLLNFADDIAIFTLTRLGLHWAWLQWLGTIVLTCTVIYWSIRLLRYCQQRQRLQEQYK